MAFHIALATAKARDGPLKTLYIKFGMKTYRHRRDLAQLRKDEEAAEPPPAVDMAPEYVPVVPVIGGATANVDEIFAFQMTSPLTPMPPQTRMNLPRRNPREPRKNAPPGHS